MTGKKLAACMLGATLIVQASLLPIETMAKELKTLTLDTAIKNAHAANTRLRIQERQTGLSKENAEYQYLIYGYYAYDAAKVTQQHNEKQEAVMKDNIELGVTQLFDNILASEKSMIQTEEAITLQEKQIEKRKLEYKYGKVSSLQLEEMNLKLEQSRQMLVKQQQEIDLLYAQLCTMIGTTVQKYQLQRPEVVFEPYRNVISIDSFAKNKAEEHIDLWYASEELRVAVETPIYRDDYITYIQKTAERETKEDQVKLTKENLVQQIKSTYTSMRQKEIDITLKKQNLELLEKQHYVNGLYLEKEMMSQLDYDLSTSELEQARLELTRLITEHNHLKYKLDHPHLI